jgi:hypothetical protein
MKIKYLNKCRELMTSLQELQIKYMESRSIWIELNPYGTNESQGCTSIQIVFTITNLKDNERNDSIGTFYFYFYNDGYSVSSISGEYERLLKSLETGINYNLND